MIDVTGDRVIDRDAEEEIFMEVLQRKGSHVLLIFDKTNRGKSALLRKLHYRCEWGDGPSIPVALIELDKIKGHHPYDVVNALAQALKPQVEALKPPIKLHRYETATRRVSSVGVARFSNSSHSGGQQAGAITNVDAGPGATTNVFTTGLDPVSQDLHRTAVIDGFLDDLFEICTEQRVVLFIDSLDGRAKQEFRDWVLRDLLRARLLDATAPPKHLFVVVAGHPDSAPVPEFKRRYPDRVASIEDLGQWSPEHLQQFLALNGIMDVKERELEFLQEMMREGWYNLEQALTMMQVGRRA
jgi:hypothetical protein